MDRSTAEKIGNYVLDAGHLDTRIIAIERGDVFCLKILNPCYFLWDWADWNEFAAQQKKQRKAERRDVAQHAIDTTEPYRLVM